MYSTNKVQQMEEDDTLLAHGNPGSSIDVFPMGKDWTFPIIKDHQKL